MRLLFAATLLAAVAAHATAQDKKGTTVELAGMKSTTPADWKEETPSNKHADGAVQAAEGRGRPRGRANWRSSSCPAAGACRTTSSGRRRSSRSPPGKKPEDVIKTEKIKLGGKRTRSTRTSRART